MKGLELIEKGCIEEISNDELLVIAKSLSEYFIGIASGSEMLDNIVRWRQFYSVSSLYGHRIGKKKSILTNFIPDQGMDLMIGDKYGILKNDENHLDSRERITKAKIDSENVFVVAIFGGSTIMGQGSRKPKFTIPALTEQILKVEYDKEVICLNYGIGATMSSDALNILMHDVLRDDPPDMIMFYDGWNCCSYLSTIESIKFLKSDSDRIIYYPGYGIRNIEHDFVLSGYYKGFETLKRSLYLLLNKLGGFFLRLFPIPFFKKVWNYILGNYLSVRPSSAPELLATFSDSENISEKDFRLASTRAVEEYVRIHDIAEVLCKMRKIRFKTFLQPLLFWGKKPMTLQEQKWRNEGTSSGNTEIFYSFFRAFKEQKRRNYMVDLTSSFDNISEQLYQDSGHLNRKGNYIIAKKLAQEISNELEF